MREERRRRPAEKGKDRATEEKENTERKEGLEAREQDRT